MNPNEPTKPPDRPDGEKPPEVPAAEPKFKVEARARYDDDVPPAPKPVSPEQVRKPKVVDKAALVAPVIVDRPQIPASDRPIARPVVDDDYDFDPLDVDPPPGMNPVLKVFLVLGILVVLLPVAGLVFLFAICAFSGL